MKTIGIIEGIGPETTIAYYQQIIRVTTASVRADPIRDHPRFRALLAKYGR